MARYPFTLVAALLSLGRADALSMMVLPQETAVGLMAPMGVSPLPTNPPGVPEGIPRELVRRATQSLLPYPPPGYYCGLVNSDPGNLLTCVNARANCVHFGTAVGCCISSNIQQCTDIATSCVNWAELTSCNAACQANPRNLICQFSTEPYCGTYFFGSGTKLFGCRSYSGVSSTVMQLSDYYSEVYGPSYTTLYTSSTSSSETDSVILPTTVTIAPTSATPSPKKKSSLTGGAIAGIAVGGLAVVAGFTAFLIWALILRKNKEPKSTPPVIQEPTQQHGQQPPGLAGYYPPDPKAGASGEPPRYSGTDYDPKTRPTPIQEMAANPVGSPFQQQSQPLLVSSGDYYNQNRDSTYSPASPQPSEMGTNQPISPNSQMLATHAGPVSTVYEIDSGR